METLSAPQVPHSPLKIVPEEYVDTPSSSVTTSPAESCTSDGVKQLKPWERTASIASSVDSSEDSEPLWEDDVAADGGGEDEEEPEGSIMVENNSKIAAQSLRMQTLVWSMQQRLQGLQQLVQEAAPQETQQSRARTFEDAERSSSSLFPAAKTVLDGDGSGSVGRCAQDLPLVDEATDNTGGQEVQNVIPSENESSPTMSTVLNRVKTLEAQLKHAAKENQQLQITVHRLEEENARLQAQTAFNPQEGPDTESNGNSGLTKSGHDQESKADERGGSVDGGISRLTSAIFGNPSAFQMVMEEDMAVLKNHERCQHKLHELWETIRTLKTFVETYELERNSMQIQRDEAIAEAERADAENVKLACSSNPQRKIKYLEQVKKDNQALRRKNRALNVRIAKQAAKLIREKNGCSVLEEEDAEASHDTLSPATLDDTILQESDEPFCERTGEEILRSMRDRRSVLEQRLERLRMARQDLPGVDGDDSSDGSELPTSAIDVTSALQGSARQTKLLLGAQS